MLKHFFFALLAIGTCLFAAELKAQNHVATIADYMQSVTAGRVTIHQPQTLNQRISPANGDTTNTATHRYKSGKNIVGYRIQVFSDRNQRTAKGEALSKEKNIKENFPDMGTYITYDAPSWRLRVGDFRTRDEASLRLSELRKCFPGYANEMIIVVDVINSDAQ